MRNAKKTLSLVMIAIFTTFIVLSGIPAGAVTASAAKAQVSKATAAIVKVEKTVKVSTFNVTTALGQYTAAGKEVAKVKNLGKTYAKSYTALYSRLTAVSKKIAARKLAIAKAAAALAKSFADADKAVAALEDAVNPDNYDLVGDPAALATAQGAVTAALEKIEALDKDSANYKGLMARVDIANGAVVKAMEEIAAADAAKEAEAAAKEAEAAAITAADTAVKAVEAAPLVTMADVTAALELGKVAAEKVAAVKTAEKVTEFTARLKAVADKGATVVASLTPAVAKTVEAKDGSLTVTFDKKPLTTPLIADFIVKQTIGTAAATTVTPTAVTVVSDTAVTVAVPKVQPLFGVEQSVVYSVVYTTGAAVTASALTIAKLDGLTATVAASNYKTVAVKFNRAVDADTITSTNVKVYVGGSTTAKTVDADATSSTVLSGQVGYIMSEDNTTLYVVFADALSVNTSVKVAIDGVVSTANTADKMTAFSSTVYAVDNTLPTFVSGLAKNVKTLVLTFSEPITNANYPATQVLPNIKIDGVSVLGTSKANYVSNTVTISLAAAMTAGNHTIAYTGYADAAGFTVADGTTTVTAVADTVIPAITAAKVVDRNTIELTFNKDITTLGTYLVGTTTVSAAAGSAANIVKLTGFTLDLSAVVEIVVTYNGTADSLGNAVTTATKYTFKTSDDTVLPTATAAIDADTNNIVLTFSKPMQLGVGTITVKNSAGTQLASFTASATAADWSSSNTVLKVVPATAGITNYAGGALTVAISGMKDNTIRQNAMLAATLSVTAVDMKAPTVANTAYVLNTTGTTPKVTIYFSEAMNTTLLNTIGNYTVCIAPGTSTVYVPLQSITNGAVSSVGADGKSVVLAVPGATSATTFNLYGLKDVAGNALGIVSDLAAAGSSVTTLAVTTATAVSLTSVKVKFNSPVASVDPSSFMLVNTTTTAAAFTFNNAQLDTADATNSTVIFTTNAAMKGNAPYDFVKSTSATNAALTKNIYGSTGSDVTAASVLVDKVAPTVTVATSATTTAAIEIKFSEAVKAADEAALTSDLVIRDADGAIVTGYTVQYLNADAVANTTGDVTNFAKLVIGGLDTTANYTVQVLSRNIKDLVTENAVTEFAATTVTAK